METDMSENVLSNEKLREIFRGLQEEAGSLLQQKEKALEVIGAVNGRLEKDEMLRNAVEDIPGMSAFAESWLKGENPEASENSVSAVLASFMYYMKTDDAIHDQIPVIGYIDDLRVFAFARELAAEDLDRFAGRNS